MRLALLTDIHANATALKAVLSDIETVDKVDAYAILGDLVNYGPRPNEVIEMMKQIPGPVMVNLWGNHEYSLFEGGLEKFATDRGRTVLKYTGSILTQESRDYLDRDMTHEGLQERFVEGLHILFVHGDIDDPYWGKLGVDKMPDDRYAKYDFVISGHTHVPHYVEYFFASPCAEFRNKKRTVFINPGSVGQPRNHNPFAQYGILDLNSGNYEHRSVWYDVEEEQRHFNDSVDLFYKTRLSLGV
jgi:predicted phosphodiesterase